MNIIQIASVCHEANRLYCECLGDFSQPGWSDAPNWQRDSVVAGVEFHRANPNAAPCASHEEWLRHKRAEGWVHGPTKDPGAKTHPCVVPYDMLPREQQIKDELFTAICGVLLQEA